MGESMTQKHSVLVKAVMKSFDVNQWGFALLLRDVDGLPCQKNAENLNQATVSRWLNDQIYVSPEYVYRISVLTGGKFGLLDFYPEFGDQLLKRKRKRAA